MLDDREQQQLDDIANDLAIQDPRFAAHIDRQLDRRLGRRERWTRACYTLVIALAAASALFCLALVNTGAAPAACPALGLAVAAYLQRRHHYGAPKPHRPRSTRSPHWPR
jgi:hypothetical protein